MHKHWQSWQQNGLRTSIQLFLSINTPKINQKKTQAKRKIVSLTLLLIPLATGALTGPSTLAQNSQDVELEVGIVQHFGENPKDQLTLKAVSGDRLNLHLETRDQSQTIEAETVQLEIQNVPLPTPMLEERVVLGTYRSFENAEETANEWRRQGIAVEIGKPDRWQVWAKRETYSTPLVRRLLLENLQNQGHKKAFLDTKVVRQVAEPSVIVNGYRYNRQQFEIQAGKGVIQVQRGKDEDSQRLYGGSLHLQPDAYGTYTLVNEVPLETYLRGVVPYEIGEGAPYAAIEAQAILARTYALRNLRRFAIDGYQLCANTQCQVYKGLSNPWPEADRAIAATAGKVLTYQNELVDALYYSTSGGITAAFTDVWQGTDRPYLVPVIDAVEPVWDLSAQNLASEQNFRRFMNLKKGFNEDDKDLFRWREESQLNELNKDFREYLQDRQLPTANFTTIQKLEVTQRSAAGRVLKMAVTTNAETIELEKDEIFRAFYAPLSTLFYLEPLYEDDKKTLKGYAFIGGGFGHGVGMSQYGSHKLAKLGWTGTQILQFYYPGTEIKLLDESIRYWEDPLTAKN
jgi:SpoIID/LytB domain protein